MAAPPRLLLAWRPNIPLGSGLPAPGPRCCRSMGAGGAPGRTSQGEATRAGSAQLGRSARSCLRWDSGIQPRQLGGERPWCQEGQPGQGLVFCMVSPAAGSWLSGMEESQVSSRVPLLTVVPLRLPCFSWQPRPGAGAGMAARAGPAPGRQPGPARLAAAPEQRDAALGSCSHPAKHNPGIPEGEGAWLPSPVLPVPLCLLPTPGSSRALAGLMSART